MPKKERFELLQMVRNAGWRVIRQEGDHYTVEKEGKTDRVHVPNTGDWYTIKKIAKKLGIEYKKRMVSEKVGGVAGFRTKREGHMPEFGTYGYQLYAARAGRRISLTDLAKLTGISYTSLVEFERNDRVPTESMQRRLAQVFDSSNLIVVKRADEQIVSTEVGPRVTDSVTVAVSPDTSSTAPVGIEQTPVSPSELPAATKREKQEFHSRRQRQYKPSRKGVKRQPRISTVLSPEVETVTYDEFNNAMLTIRTFAVQQQKAAEKWSAIKDLIKDEE